MPGVGLAYVNALGSEARAGQVASGFGKNFTRHRLEMNRNSPCFLPSLSLGNWQRSLALLKALEVPNPEKGVHMMDQWMSRAIAPFSMR